MERNWASLEMMFDLGQSGFIRLRPMANLGQFDLGQFDWLTLDT